MAVYSIVKLSELEGAKRIDAEFYKPEYLYLKNLLFEKGALAAKNFIQPLKRKFKTKDDRYFDYIEISEVDLGTGEFKTSRILGKEAPDRAQWIVKKGDVLVSTVRPNRNAVTLIEKNDNILVCSSGFAVIGPKESILNHYYIFAYYKTQFAKKLLERCTTATEYPAITWQDVLKLPFYFGSKGFISLVSKFVKESFELLSNSNSLYDQAEDLLLQELGLKDYKPQYKKTYTAKLSDALSARRIDAEYFQPAYEEVMGRIKTRDIEIKPLKSFLREIQKGVEVGSENYLENGKLFIRVSNLSVNGFADKDQKYISDEIYQKFMKYKPNVGDFLLTKDATPGIAYVVKEDVEGIISSGIVKLKIDETQINKEYLALCINSVIGKSQVEREGGGSVIVHWKPSQINKLKIPMLKISLQHQIAELVQKSHQSRKKAKELLEIAKRAVEIAIEKNEEEALNFISSLQNLPVDITV